MAFMNEQGLGIHVKTVHSTATMFNGVRLQRMLGKDTKADVLPWERAGSGRCWRAEVDGTTGASVFVLQRKHLFFLDLESDGFTPKTKETRGAVKHIRYDFRSKAHVINQLCLLEESPDELLEVEHLSPQQYLETFLKIDHSLISSWSRTRTTS